MKRSLRFILLVCVILSIGSIILLLNITAPNPTGRRYSSEMPLTTRQGDAQAIGLSAELILSKDLRLPRNEDASQRQCICGSSMVAPDGNQCPVCLTYSPAMGTYRRPDFIGHNFIAESKNRQSLLYTHTDQIEQIADYVIAARGMKQPLYLYTRVNTYFDPEFVQLVESTGGAVIPYFTVPGYVDPVDTMARVSLMLSFGTMLVLCASVWTLGRFKMPRIVVSSPKAPRPPRQPNDPASRAIHKTESAEAFIRTRKERERQKIEIEDSRDEY